MKKLGLCLIWMWLSACNQSTPQATDAGNDAPEPVAARFDAGVVPQYDHECFDVGEEELHLHPAPGHLCRGDGEKKQCEDGAETCEKPVNDQHDDVQYAGADDDAGWSFRSHLEPICLELDAKPVTRYMSADDSSSIASPVIARWLIRQGRDVPREVIRPHEFLNYYDFDFDPAPAGEIAIRPQLSACPNDGQLSFQVALQSERRSREDRRPLNVTFVLDTSGSMDGRPISIEKAAVRAIARQLKKGDVVSMVTWSTVQDDVLTGHEVSGPYDPVVLAAVQRITSGGGTDLHAGLVRGYELATRHRSSDRINRVILISDGQANAGVTDLNLIARHADDEESEDGIYLAGIGVGEGYNDTLMDAVTDRGRGAYVFLDTEDEADRTLDQRFLQIVDVAARSVRLEMTLPWYMGVKKFYGEKISRNKTEVFPQHLAPNDAMVFFQILEACDPSLIHGDDRIRLHATWETPFTRIPRSTTIDTTFNDLAGDDKNLLKATAITTYAEALIAVAQRPFDRYTIIEDALEVVENANAQRPDRDLVEIINLLHQYR